MSPKLSIIVPFYNMEDILGYCLDSLLDQSLDPEEYEIIAVDDCSSDHTYGRLQEYELAHPGRIRSFRTPRNLHQGGARNLGMAEAFGEWIGFLDGDDQAHPMMFRKMLERARDTGADVVGCGLCEVHDHSFEGGVIKNGNTPDQSGILNDDKYKKLILNPCSMVTKIYKREVIEREHLDFPQDMFYEDNAAAPIWLLHFKHFELVDEPLYYYYQKEGSTTHTITKERCLDRMKAGELMISMARERGLYERFHDEFEASFTRLYYANTLFSYMIGCKGADASLPGLLRKGMLQYFPGFYENRYYGPYFDEEQKKLMEMNMKSPSFFVLYYKLLTAYRRLRKNGHF